MAIRIRCAKCKKKASVDEAFAGAVCRCPYCAAMMIVPSRPAATAAGGPRPEAPAQRIEALPAGRPETPPTTTAADRPAPPTRTDVPPVVPSPAPLPAGRPSVTVFQRDMPTARPVGLRGLLALILLAAVLVLAVVVIVLLAT